MLQHGSRISRAVDHRAIFPSVERQVQPELYRSFDSSGVMLPDAWDVGAFVRRSVAQIGQPAIEVRQQRFGSLDGLWTTK